MHASTRSDARRARTTERAASGTARNALADASSLTLRWLEIAISEKASGLILLRVHPRLDSLRKDPRYWPMVERVGLAG